MARPRTATFSLAGSRATISSITSGVSVKDTSVAMRVPTAGAARSAPRAVTVPTSIPPDPVTGLCILPAPATISVMRSRMASASPPASVRSWCQEAESTFRYSTSISTSPLRSGSEVSRRRACCGNTPRGSRDRCTP